MFYQTTPDSLVNTSSRTSEYSGYFPVTKKFDQTHRKLLEQKILWQQLLRRQAELKPKKAKLESRNSIWDTVKLSERFKKEEYQSQQTRIGLLRADAIHHAKEMALVEPVTRFSYSHTVTNNETIAGGYSEDLGFMMSTFAQDLAEKGLSASRASVESVSFERAKQMLTQIAIQIANNKSGETLSKQGVLITSFPDDTESGYHGVDSKHSWDKTETHHSFFYLLRVGKIETDQTGNVISFEINTTQYRAWPNIRQALRIHEQLGSPITEIDAPVPNLLFANLIHLDAKELEKIALELGITTHLEQEKKPLLMTA